tara:strand:- start:13 stop:267 length:255 start_codon:yes stop_codon:yes gene_type:complete
MKIHACAVEHQLHKHIAVLHARWKIIINTTKKNKREMKDGRVSMFAVVLITIGSVHGLIGIELILGIVLGFLLTIGLDKNNENL